MRKFKFEIKTKNAAFYEDGGKHKDVVRAAEVPRLLRYAAN